ncbi:hypothetical protein [Mucilaginibacter phyllosphaerae]
MNYLERLDLHPTVRSFFQPFLNKITNEEVIINYYDSIEHATADFHRIPITENHWIAGNMAIASQLIISSSAMDAIAWLHQNHNRYPDLNDLAFISVGAYPTTTHTAIIQQYAPNKKLHFVFSNDPTGALCDLKLASWVHGIPIKISYQDHQYHIGFQHQTFMLSYLSLSALEKQSRHHFHIRTHKPKSNGTYYQQLRRHHP